MAIPRASVNVIRACIRPGAGVAPLRRLAFRQQSTVSSDGDFGGLGGQQTPPSDGRGRDFFKRNRVQIGGAALLFAIAMSYMSSSSKGSDSPRDLRAASSTEIGMLPPAK